MKRMLIRAAGIAFAPFVYMLRRWRRRSALRKQARAEAMLMDVRSLLERSPVLAAQWGAGLRLYEMEVRQVVVSMSFASPDWGRAGYILDGLCDVIARFRSKILKIDAAARGATPPSPPPEAQPQPEPPSPTAHTGYRMDEDTLI